jgi:hypothetical protein
MIFSTIMGEAIASFGFEIKAGELQRSTVLAYRSHQIIRCSIRNFGLDFQSDFHFSSRLLGQMLHDLVGDGGYIAAESEWVERYGTMIAPGRWRLGVF